MVEYNTNVAIMKAYSDHFTLRICDHLTDQEFRDIISLQTDADALFESLSGSVGRDQAMQQVLKMFLESPFVIQAGLSGSGKGIWALYTSEIFGGVDFSEDGQRGGGIQVEESTFGRYIHQMNWDKHPLEVEYFIDGDKKTGSGENELIKSTRTLILAPYYHQFSPSDESKDINELLKNTQCPFYDITYLRNETAGSQNITPESFKNWSAYGIIVVTSHGDTQFEGLWQEFLSWFGLSEPQVIVLTGYAATVSNKKTYEDDLKSGRLVLINEEYCVTPKFIETYSTTFPDSIVYVGSCRSAFNQTLSNALLSKKAKTFFGYSEYVQSHFAYDCGKNLFRNMVENNKVTGEAFVPGQHDGNTPPAYFMMFGSDNLSIKPTDLQNGGFEIGTLGGWTAEGDGRVIQKLGPMNPVDGSYMGIISTGLGFTVDSGSIKQKVCVPSNVKRLNFFYDFLSEEFLEWCDDVYQDYFTVTIQPDGGNETTLFYIKIDDLCNSVTSFPTSFDQDGVYHTGWQELSLDISVYENLEDGAMIKFAAGDIGDSIYDTAILLDNIRFE